MTERRTGRRAVIAGLGAVATGGVVGSRAAQAQGATPFTPARHPQDDWMDTLPGKHRVILDMTTPAALPEGVRFAGNLFTGHKNGYGLEDRDVAIIMVLRHSATAYGYTDAIWSKYGRSMGGGNTDPAAAPPAANAYNTGDNPQLAGLARRGVHFVICGSASLGLARRIAGSSGDADAVGKEMAANLLPNGHLTMGVAGVVPVSHAQERGYSYLFVG